MGIPLFMRLLGLALVGMLTNLILKHQSFKKDTDKNNLQYDGFWGFVKNDWGGVVLNLCAIVVTFLLAGDLVDKITAWSMTQTYSILSYQIPLRFAWYIFNGLFFYATGYFGQDFILRKVVKSVQSKLIKDAIDYKTTIADQATNNLGNKTPLK